MVNHIITLQMIIFQKYAYFFCHLKLGCALAIPALSEWKMGSKNLAGQGLRKYIDIIFYDPEFIIIIIIVFF